MYKVNATVRGTAPLLQHRFGAVALDSIQQGASKRTGAPDYALEWMGTMYVNQDGHLFQPAAHIEGAMVRAASSFKVKGARGKTWKDPIRAYAYVTPDEILHLERGKPIVAPGPELLEKPRGLLSVSVMRVKVQRAAVARSRLMLNAGWMLNFNIEVHDEQVRPDVLREILEEAGRAVGIGDFRPRYGRFDVVDFKL